MTKMTLIGVDPGIKDTGLVALRFDSREKTWSVGHQVWADVPRRNEKTRAITELDPAYTIGLPLFLKQEESNAPTFSGVEGYRQRGNNVRQDQDMLYMVDKTHKLMPGSMVVDNTGIKNVVTRDMLKLFGVARFNESTNHADLVSASRVALKVGISIPVLNEILYQFILDNVEGEPWSLVSM
jgi:hypothetical protein